MNKKKIALVKITFDFSDKKLPCCFLTQSTFLMSFLINYQNLLKNYLNVLKTKLAE